MLRPFAALFRLTAFTAFLTTVAATPILAQTGDLTGRITDAETGNPLAVASVQVSGPESRGSVTDGDGRFRFAVPAGTYSLVVSLIGYEAQRIDGIRVVQGGEESVDLALRSRALILNPIVATVGRGVEQKAVDAPASVSVVHEEDIRVRPAPSALDHLRNVPGVDIATHGLQSGTLVTRGFNNVFSGSLHMLTDHRIAGIPSLRVNLMHIIPTTDEDIERMEVVLGPGSALYGPNTANGVLHVLTRSPLESQGTSFSLAGGEQDLFHGTFRTSHLLRDDFGIKVSGQHLRGNEWRFIDPIEAEERDRILTEDPGADTRVGLRDFDIERWSAEVRADWQADDRTRAIFQTGHTLSASAIELTGIGASQIQDWWSSYYQLRVNRDRLFGQVYLNTSDAGETYNLRDGGSIVDRSRLLVSQLQHGARWGDRQDFTYGVDYIRTMPRTSGTIHGRYEDEDTYDEIGVYLQSETGLSDRFDFVAAGRVDWHSELPSAVFSPRAALVFRPAEGQSLRATYNRAFSTPTSVNLFLDINAGPFPDPLLAAAGYGLRAQGSAGSGFSFRGPDGTLTGMRSPFNPAGADQLMAIDGAYMWGTAVQIAALLGQIDPATADFLAGETPTGGEVDAGYMVDLTGLVTGEAPLRLTDDVSFDIPPLEESVTTTWELGYSGLLSDRLLLSADLWYSRRDNFVSDLRASTPLLFVHGESAADYIGPDLVQFLITDQGMTPAEAQAEAQRVISAMAGIPVGVLSSDDISTAPGRSDLLITYANFGSVNLWGTDVSAQVILDDRWRMNVAGSWVNRDHFITEEGQRISLNAPTTKFSAGLQYRDTFRGWNAELRGRYNGEFPVLSGVYEGTACIEDASVTGALPCVGSHFLVDISAGYRIPMLPGAAVHLTVQNLFDEDYRSFIGAPEVGRLALLRVRYDF